MADASRQTGSRIEGSTHSRTLLRVLCQQWPLGPLPSDLHAHSLPFCTRPHDPVDVAWSSSFHPLTFGGVSCAALRPVLARESPSP